MKDDNNNNNNNCNNNNTLTINAAITVHLKILLKLESFTGH